LLVSFLHFPIIVFGDNVYSLISGVILDDSVVITSRTCFSAINDRYELLRDVEPNRILLRKLMVTVPSRKVSYGYFIGSKYYTPSKLLAEQYYRVFWRKGKPDDRWLMEHSEQYYVFDITANEVAYLSFELLNSEGRIIVDKVKGINVVKKKIYGKYEEYTYDRLIVTVPAYEFLSLAGIEKEKYKFFSAKTNVFLVPYTDIPARIREKLEELDYAYIIGNSPLPFFRLSNSGRLVLGETFDFFPEKYVYCWENRNGFIVSSKWKPEQFEVLNIYFVGREAKFQHYYRIYDAVAELVEIQEKIS